LNQEEQQEKRRRKTRKLTKFKKPKTVDMMVRATTRAGTQKSRKSGKPSKSEVQKKNQK
jgi:hypothetical protein